ncbi:hypothetical protein SDC9_162154 [bioreactor metagenome]|uniref:Uncharacterized protein n=1 Tax=bioreactor metagenome TaxID=1076179 RepID=A0A645FKA6_9ZZZZ
MVKRTTMTAASTMQSTSRTRVMMRSKRDLVSMSGLLGEGGGGDLQKIGEFVDEQCVVYLLDKQ